MESQIEALLEKYWEGKTSLAEEQEIREYFAKNPSLEPEGLWFRNLQRVSESKSPKTFANPARKQFRSWFGAAASIVVGIIIGLVVLIDARNYEKYHVEDPEKAMEITKKALMMVSSGLNEGAKHSTELKKINKAEELIKETND